MISDEVVEAAARALYAHWLKTATSFREFDEVADGFRGEAEIAIRAAEAWRAGGCKTWRVREVVGATPNTIGYADRPELRLAARVEGTLNEGAAEGYLLDRIERHGDHEAMVVMQRPLRVEGSGDER